MKKFDISTTSDQADGLSLAIVHVQGYLDSSTFPQLQEHLELLIQQEQYRIAVDLMNLNYISSAGIGVLMGMLQEVRSRDGDLKLVNMSSKIQNLFDMLGFSRLIRIYDSVDAVKVAFLEESRHVTNADEQTPAEENY